MDARAEAPACDDVSEITFTPAQLSFINSVFLSSVLEACTVPQVYSASLAPALLGSHSRNEESIGVLSWCFWCWYEGEGGLTE